MTKPSFYFTHRSQSALQLLALLRRRAGASQISGTGHGGTKGNHLGKHNRNSSKAWRARLPRPSWIEGIVRAEIPRSS